MRKTGRVMAGACARPALGATTALAGDEFQLPENKYEGRLDRGDRGTYVGFNLRRVAKTVVKKVAVSAPFECRAETPATNSFRSPVASRWTTTGRSVSACDTTSGAFGFVSSSKASS